MTSLARFSLANRALVALVCVLAVAAGVFSAVTLRRELIPSLELPLAAVVTPYPGASPEVVETEVSDVVESAVAGVPGLVSTSSSSSSGLSSVTLELEYGTSVGEAQREVQQAVTRAARLLPEDVVPQVITGSVEDLPVVQLAVSAGPASGDGTVTQADLVRAVETVVLPDLEDVDGVRDASLSGAAGQQVLVALTPEGTTALAGAGLGPDAVAGALAANGVVAPGGTLTTEGRTLDVQVGSRLSTAEDVAAVPLAPGAAPAAEVLTVGDVASVASVPAPTTSLARTDGEPSIGIAVTRTPDGNTVAISDEVGALLPDLRAALEEQTGQDAALTVVFDQAPFIDSSVEDLAVEGVLGLAFAVLVILVFLLSVRSTLVTAVSIPLSLLVALVGLFAGGYTLNLLTLSALTISIGRVVDDSIVVVENITRHLRMPGADRRTAITTGVREVAAAVTASTVTTSAVFLPLAVVGGTAGELFRPFAVTVALALGASLLVSLTIVPVLCSWFLRVPEGASGAEGDGADGVVSAAAGPAAEPPDRLQRGYLPVLRASLRRPLLTLAAAVAVLAATVGLATTLETDFLGSSGQNTLTVTQQMPPGTSLEATDEAARRVEAVIADQPEVVTQQVTVGSSDPTAALFGGGAGGSSTASFAVTLALGDDAEALRDRLRAELDDLDGVGEVTTSLGQGGPGTEGVEVVVQAPDEASLREATAQVRDAVAGTPGAEDVSDDLAAELPTLTVAVDRERAAAVGLTEAAVGQAISARTQGSTIGVVESPDGAQDVVLRVGDAPTDVPALAELPLAAPLAPDGTVPLSSVAAVEEVAQPTSISRRDGRRSATVQAAVAADEAGGLGALSQELDQRLTDLELPAGASATLGGVSADQEETFGQLGLALLAAIAIVYTVMVATFRSLVQPVLLLVSIPFAATGALAVLAATDTPLGVAGLIGALMLVGIVVTNAIVLIDLVNQYRRRGLGVLDAVVEGARHRLRPILMTAAATVLALTPMALGLTGGSAFISQPLALVVIGGLVSSTVLTLVIVPVLYLLVERRSGHRMSRREYRRARREAARRALAAFDAEHAQAPGSAGGGSSDGGVSSDGSAGSQAPVAAARPDGATAGTNGAALPPRSVLR